MTLNILDFGLMLLITSVVFLNYFYSSMLFHTDKIHKTINYEWDYFVLEFIIKNLSLNGNFEKRDFLCLKEE